MQMYLPPLYVHLCIMLLAILAALYLVNPLWVWAQNTTSGSNLNFGPIDFGGYNNYVYRDNVTSGQVVITEWVSDELKQ